MSLLNTLSTHSTRLLLSAVLLAAAAAVALPVKASEAALLDDVAMAMSDGGADGADGMPGMMGRHGMHGGPGAAGGHGAMGHGHGIGRMLDMVNASADQRARITSIMDAARNDLKTQHQSRQALRQQQQALFAQPTIDARAAEALRQQMLAQHDSASKRMLQARLEVANVLTPDQRKMVAERMAQRRAMMERHRSERQSLERR